MLSLGYLCRKSIIISPGSNGGYAGDDSDPWTTGSPSMFLDELRDHSIVIPPFCFYVANENYEVFGGDRDKKGTV